jgi:hypothetical protein
MRCFRDVLGNTAGNTLRVNLMCCQICDSVLRLNMGTVSCIYLYKFRAFYTHAIWGSLRVIVRKL